MLREYYCSQFGLVCLLVYNFWVTLGLFKAIKWQQIQLRCTHGHLLTASTLFKVFKDLMGIKIVLQFLARSSKTVPWIIQCLQCVKCWCALLHHHWKNIVLICQKCLNSSPYTKCEQHLSTWGNKHWLTYHCFCYHRGCHGQQES